jgi:uncharacterized protein with NRDE domain
MCTIAFLVGVAEVPLVIAANRDELYARPTRPPESLAPHVMGGIDVISGGTWLAIDERGYFAAVTNQRALDPPPPGLRSRGLAVKELVLAFDPDAYVTALDPRAYASMNLAWGHADQVSVAYLRVTGEKQVERLPRGIHVLCNDRLRAPGFPRGERLRAAIEPHVGAPWPELAAVLQKALGDHTKVEPTVKSHLAPELARELTATCIHSEHYGTRSSTIAAFDLGGLRSYLHADGPPCVTPFREVFHA